MDSTLKNLKNKLKTNRKSKQKKDEIKRKSNNISQFDQFPEYDQLNLNTLYQENENNLINLNANTFIANGISNNPNGTVLHQSIDLSRKRVETYSPRTKSISTPRFKSLTTEEKKLLIDVENGDLENLKLDLKNKKYLKFIDAYDDNGETALLNAAYAGRIDMMTELIEAGADIKLASNKDMSNPLHHLCKQYKKKTIGSIENYTKLIYKMVHLRINLMAKDESGNTVFHLAAKVGNKKVLKILLPHCLDINIENNYGDTPILFSAKAKQLKTCQLLFEYGANIYLKCGPNQESAYDFISKTMPNNGDPKFFFWKNEFVEDRKMEINDLLFRPSNDTTLKTVCGPIGENANQITGVYSMYKSTFFNQTHYVFYFQDQVPSSSKIVCVMKNAKNGEHKSLLINLWGIWKISIQTKHVSNYSMLSDDFAVQLKYYLNDYLTSKRIEVVLLKPRLEYDQLVKLQNTCTTKTSTLSFHLWNEISVRNGINLDLLGLEAKIGSVSLFSVGVVLGIKGQKDEEEMFLNEYMSESFTKFLDILGDEVDSKGWAHFAGGLPYENSVKFYYSGWRGFEIAFHVAPFLSAQERRQHIGNDKAIIYFVDDPMEINFRGNVNSIGLVVKEQDNDMYDLGIFYRNRVDKFHPHLPKKSFTRKEIRDVIFINLINGIESVSKSHPYSATIDTLFENEISNIIQKHKK